MNCLLRRSNTIVDALRIGLLAFTLGFASAGAAPAMGDMVAHGNFRQMTHSGDTSGRIALADLARRPGSWGVGATAGLLGEIVQIDGELLVTPGSDGTGVWRSPAPGEQAALFAGALVTAWREVPVTRDLTPEAFEAFLVEAALAAGLPADAPFVFRVAGRFPHLLWHVVTGEVAPMPATGSMVTGAHGAGGGHGTSHGAMGGSGGAHANQRAGLRLFRQPGASGQLVGVYSGASLEGVVSHPGERLHLHYVDTSASVSGHVDRFSVAAGSVLLVPVR